MWGGQTDSGGSPNEPRCLSILNQARADDDDAHHTGYILSMTVWNFDLVEWRRVAAVVVTSRLSWDEVQRDYPEILRICSWLIELRA